MLPAQAFLGVDGGGTQTRAVIVDGAGREIGRGRAGSANAQVIGPPAASAHIHEAVAQAARAAGVSLPLAAAWCGLAGIDRPADQAALGPLLADLAPDLRLTNDAELGLAGLPGACGVCLIAGTGSIAVGRDAQGRSARAGGWGYILGDEGSGYDLGRRALHAVVRAADGRAPATALTGRILAAWHLAVPPDLIGQVYPDAGTARIATLAALVFEAAGAGDPVARRIVAAGAGELAVAALAAAARLDFPGALPLALVGGILTGQPAYQAAVVRRLRRRRAVRPVVAVSDPALTAARALARPGAPPPGRPSAPAGECLTFS